MGRTSYLLSASFCLLLSAKKLPVSWNFFIKIHRLCRDERIAFFLKNKFLRRLYNSLRVNYILIHSLWCDLTHFSFKYRIILQLNYLIIFSDLIWREKLSWKNHGRIRVKAKRNYVLPTQENIRKKRKYVLCITYTIFIRMLPISRQKQITVADLFNTRRRIISRNWQTDHVSVSVS